MHRSIPIVDIGPLFGPPSPSRDLADRALMSASATFGFLAARGCPPEIPLGRAARAELLRLFELPSGETRKLWRQKFDPAHANVYRGWFPLQQGFLTAKEGIDMGGDVLHGPAVVCAEDPLRETTPLPSDEALPGWRAAVREYYRAMETVSQALMRSIARGLALDEHFFDAAFEKGLSTLRLLRYPVRVDAARVAESDPGVWVMHQGQRFYVNGAPHVDSGFLTLLAQDGIAGLQARHLDGTWLDVPPMEDALAVNFGKVLERWSGGRLRATEHRVIGNGRERMSIPFFYEARADAEIRPLPMDPAAAFEPFLFGDYLWATTTKFVEFKGMEGLRKPLRPGVN
ncbi:MAG TPA: 2OG-Fe(II) oxygenase family protein [Steroidobacteraceae bacterium]|nr:2OG-Fe(II) oxygenase family protein [Steroidobacteraceae bacterium]